MTLTPSGSNFQNKPVTPGGSGGTGSLEGAWNTAGFGMNNLGYAGYGNKNPTGLTPLIKQYQGIVNNQIENNPWAGTAMSGATSAMGMGQNAAGLANWLSGGLDQTAGYFNALSPQLTNQGMALNNLGSSTLNTMMGQLPGLLGNANDILGNIPGLSDASNQILKTGFDPQNALYNRTQQQLTDQLRAANAASGLSSSPYGAGLEGQGLSNFNIDWQNNLLNRMNTAAGGAATLQGAIGSDVASAGGLYNTISGLPGAASGIYNIGQGLMGEGMQAGTLASDMATSALGLGQGATALESSATQLPYQMGHTIATNRLGGLDALASAKSNAFNQRSTGLQDVLQYLGMGNEYLRTMISQQGENLAANQSGLGNLANAGSSIINLIPAISSFFGGG